MGGRIRRKDEVDTLSAMIKNAKGIVKVGEKDPRGFPRSLGYFVGGGEYKALFDTKFNKPTTIKITFPSDNPELVCKEEYVLRDSKGKLYAEGDGYEFRFWSEKEQRYIVENTDTYPNLMEILESRTKTKFEISLTLVFVIFALRNVATFWKLTTKGDASSIPNIRDAFDDMLQRNGTCAGVVWDLSVKMHTSNTPNKSSKYPVISITANETEESIEEVKGYIENSNLMLK